MFLLRYSREAEHESDTLGVNYATRSGYAAEQSARFFQTLQRISTAEGKALPTWQSTHPDPGDRAQRVVTIANQIPADTRTNIGEEEYLRHIEGMVVGDDPREGFVRNHVFYHPTLRFQLPVAQGWKVDNQRAAVVMAEPSGKARMGLRLADGANARDAALRFPQQAKVQIVTSGDTMVNGLRLPSSLAARPQRKARSASGTRSSNWRAKCTAFSDMHPSHRLSRCAPRSNRLRPDSVRCAIQASRRPSPRA